MSGGVTLYLLFGVLYAFIHYFLNEKMPRDDKWVDRPTIPGLGPLVAAIWPIVLLFDGIRMPRLLKLRRSLCEARKHANGMTSLQRLDSIIVPHVDLKQANLRMIAEFLNSFSSQLGRKEGKLGVRVIQDLSSASDISLAARHQALPICITYKNENVSLLQLIKDLSALAGVRYTIYGDRYLMFDAGSA